MAASPDYYEVLQVSPSADPEVVQAAYRRLSLKWHPDRNPGDGSAPERMRLLNEAYAVLSDTRRRREYDAGRGRGATPGGGGGEPPGAKAGECPEDEPAAPPPGEDPAPGERGWLDALPDAPVILVAGGVLFLVGHGGILFGEPPAGPLAFLLTCFVWGMLFGTPAYLCWHYRNRTGLTLVATLFLLAAGVDVLAPLLIGREAGAVARDHRRLPRRLSDEEIAQLKSLAKWGAYGDAFPKNPTLRDSWVPPEEALPRLLEAGLQRGRSWDEVRGDIWQLHATLREAEAEAHSLTRLLRESNDPFLRDSPLLTMAAPEVSKEVRQLCADPERLRLPYQFEAARRKAETDGESLVDYLARRAIPVAGAVGTWKRVGRYVPAVERFNAGKASREDIDLIVRFERQQGLNRQPPNHAGGAAK
jgi:hypothetical protein